MNQEKRDEVYLGIMGKAIIADMNSRLQYLQFLITINIALFGAIYLSKPESIWEITDIRVFLSLLLIIINSALCFTYLRQHNIAKIREEQLRIATAYTNPNSVAFSFSEALEKDKLRGKGWETTKWLLSGLISLPLAYFLLILLIYFFPLFKQMDCIVNSKWIELFFALGFVFFICLIYFCFSRNEHKSKREQEKNISVFTKGGKIMKDLFEGLWAVTIGKLFAVGALLVAVNFQNSDFFYWLFWGAIGAEVVEKVINIFVDGWVPKQRQPKPWVINNDQKLVD